MKEIYGKILAALCKGEDVILCTIIAVFGSTPRNAGAKMAVFSNGSSAGTIGGGSVEFAALQRARQALERGTACVEQFQLHQSAGDVLGMMCDGTVTVYFQLLCGKIPYHRQLTEEILKMLDEPVNSWLITEIRMDDVWTCGIYDGERGLRFLPDGVETDLLRWMVRRPVLTKGDRQYLIEPLGLAERLYVFGGGHVSQTLVPVLTNVGFRVTVLENRPEFADKALFPTADQVVLTEFAALTQRFAVTQRDGILIMTRGHGDDYQIVRQALETKAGYVGVIGSRRKAELTLERLRSDGVSASDIHRIHSPIGLPIGAETPEEIAVSVAAELIAHRAMQTDRR